MKRAAEIVVAFTLCAAFPSGAAEPVLLTNDESYVLVDKLLQLNPSNKDSLSQYREWEAQYMKIRANAHKGIKQMALYQFVVFIADARSSIQTLEDIGLEIVDIYNKDKNLFLSALNNNPVFVHAVCSELGGHFTLVGKTKDVEDFISANQPLIEKLLYAPYAKKCVAELRR